MSDSSNSGGGGYGYGPVILYGITIQDAIKRGNQDEIRELLQQARSNTNVKKDCPIDQAIADLENALK